MNEIRLIAFLAPQTGVQQSGQISQGGGSQLPGAIFKIPHGSLLSGFIINRDAQGNPVLRTEQGDVTFHSDIFLKIGSEVTIRIENRAGQTSARILTIDGLPPEVAVKVTGPADPSEIIVNRPTTSAPAASSTIETATATLDDLPPPSPVITTRGILLTPAMSGPFTPLPAGSELQLKLVSLTAGAAPLPPAGNAPMTAATQAPSSPPPLSYAAYGRVAAGVPAPAETPTVQRVTTTLKQMAAEFLGKPAPATTTTTTTTNAPVAPTSVQTTAQTPPQPGQAIAATVVASEPNGEALVQTPLGIVRIPADTALAVGSKAVFEIASIRPAAAGATENTVPAPLPELARNWQSLQQLSALLTGENVGILGAPSGMELLAGHRPGQLAPPPGSFMPQQISTGLMFFIAALKGNDFRSWLGQDHADWLEINGHGALLKKAEGEFSAIARQFIETPPHQWQTLFFPVPVSGEWQQARMFVKREKKKSTADNKADEDTRFVIEMELSQLGEIQMDGFVQRQEKSVEFDLYIRSLRGLEQDMQREILDIYNRIGELTGYKGQLLFQTVRQFPVHPMEEIMAHALGNVTA